jgi:RNA polymerase sigma-70 factor (ECF subfamily)
MSDDDGGVLVAAQGGDEQAFEALVAPHRRELRAHCYRMLGSAEDADDLLQETLVRAWRGLPRFEGRSSLRTWLYRIATNACLNRLERRPPRTVPLDHGPPTAPGAPPGDLLDREMWLGPYPDRLLADDEAARPEAVAEQLESVELAFVTALMRLTPQARAVLILRSVLEYSAQETADALGTTVAAVNSALQRARATVRRDVPGPSQREAVAALGDDKVRDLVGRYTQALQEADVDGMLALLHEDATWSMPPLPAWYQGHEAIASFLTDYAMTTRWRHLTTHCNGQPAVGCYAWHEETGTYRAWVLDVLTLRADRIVAVTAFLDPNAVLLCGLPEVHPGE